MSGEMIDEHAAAEALFGGTTFPEEEAPDTAKPAPLPGSFEEQAEAVYQNEQVEIPDQTVQAIAVKLDGLDDGLSSEELNDAQREELYAELPRALAASGMDSQGAGEFGNLVRSQINQPATERAVRQWEEESITLARNMNYTRQDIRGRAGTRVRRPPCCLATGANQDWRPSADATTVRRIGQTCPRHWPI